jgi:hypothetical protein
VLGAFNTVYTALKGFFSRGFWFSTFLPVALFSAFHCLIALAKYGSLSLFGMNLSLSSAPTGDFSQAAPLIVVALVVTSFALAPFVDYLRGLLDGSLLPKALHDWLRKRRHTIARGKEEELKALFDDLGAVSDVNDRYSADEGPIRTTHVDAVARAPKTATNEDVVTAARDALAALDKGVAGAKPLAPLATAAEAAVVAALQQNAPDIDDATRPEETMCSKATDEAASDLGGKLRNAVLVAKYRYQIVKDRYRVVNAIEFPWATALGDARFIAESYPRNTYNVEFDYLWPRLQMALKAAKNDDSRLEAIENARANIEFAVLSFFLAVTIPLASCSPISSASGSLNARTRFWHMRTTGGGRTKWPASHANAPGEHCG